MFGMSNSTTRVLLSSQQMKAWGYQRVPDRLTCLVGTCVCILVYGCEEECVFVLGWVVYFKVCTVVENVAIPSWLLP